MIRSKKELRFYIMADMMMNRNKFKWNLKDRIRHLIFPDYIMRFLKSMRYCSYYKEKKSICNILYLYHFIRFRKLSLKLGFSINSEVFGYGLVIPHHGTIVVGNDNKIGNYAVLHTSTCITNGNKLIGDGLYLSTGAKIIGNVQLGDNVSVGANSVVNKNVLEGNCLLTGIPALKKKDEFAWYIRDGKKYETKVKKIEELRMSYLKK